MPKQEEIAHFSKKNLTRLICGCEREEKKMFNKSLWKGIEYGFGDYHGSCFKLNSGSN